MERINTGGLTEIRYPKGYKPREISLEEEERIDTAWARVKARKRRKIIIRVVILAIIISLGIYFLN